MSEKEQTAAYEKLMATNLQRAIEFVKFAEAKNAALVTLCSAWIVLSLSNIDKDTPPIILSSMIVGLPLLALGAAYSLSSFLPNMDLLAMLRFGNKQEEQSNDYHNLLFFGHISKAEGSEFYLNSRRRYFATDKSEYTDRYLEDLAEQVFANSKIASEKMSAFTSGLERAGLGAAIMVICLFVHSFYAIWS